MKIDVAKLLLNAGYSNVFVVDPPDTEPDKVTPLKSYILISNSGGFGLNVEDAGFSRPTIQIIIADKNPETMDSVGKSITEYLINLEESEIRDLLSRLFTWDEYTVWTNYNKWDTYLRNDDDTVYQSKMQGFDLLSDTLDLGRDEQLRYMESINFTVFYNII